MLFIVRVSSNCYDTVSSERFTVFPLIQYATTYNCNDLYFPNSHTSQYSLLKLKSRLRFLRRGGLSNTKCQQLYILKISNEVPTSESKHSKDGEY